MKTVRRLLCFLLAGALATAWGQTRYFINTVAGSNNLGDNGPAAQALLFIPVAVAVDAQRNLYIADTFNNRIRKVTAAGTITTIACTGVPGWGGDGEPATQALCNSPNGVAVDAAGNVYFSDSFNHYVRKVGLDGTVSAVAGNGFAGFGDDGEPATSASLNQPSGLAVDAGGNLYIADHLNNRIRQVSPTGIINTVAGTDSCLPSGDGGPATQASLCAPLGVAVDPQGRVLVADTGNGRIRRFVPGGVISTVAGTSPGFGGDNGAAIAASLLGPAGVAVSNQGVIYIADSYNHRIREVQTNGIISTIAGAQQGFSGDGGMAFNGMLNTPKGIALDNQGNIYIADMSNNRVRMITPSGILSTYAGYGHYLGDNGPAVSAVMSEPAFVTLDSSGDLLVSDTYNHVIRKVDTTGKITTIAGTGIAGALGDGGPAVSAQLNSPQGLVFDSSGNLYVADSLNNTVRKISPNGVITKVAGGGTTVGDGGPAQTAMLNAPNGLAVDAKGNLYVADSGNDRVRMIAPNGVIGTVIGDGTAQSSGDGGLATAGEVDDPWDVKVANDGTIYITEFHGGRIRAIAPTGIVRSIGGYFNYPAGLAIDPSGNIIAGGDFELDSIAPSGALTTIAGEGAGFGGDGGPALQAQLDGPNGIALDAQGNIYFCDQQNNRIRKLSPDTVSQLVYVSGNQQSATSGTVLPLPLEVQVNGASGAPFPGVTVNYMIISGGGRLSATQTVTGSDGRAGVTLTLPVAAGTVTVTATVKGLSPVTFTAIAVNGPGSIQILGGNNQSGVAGSTLQQILAVLVLGVNQGPISGVPVTFAVTSGSATLNPSSMPTAADGSAYTQVTLGPTAGPITVTATVAGLAPVTFSITAAPANGPQISPGGVVSAGLSSPALQTTAPNAIVSIFGKNFAPAGMSRKVSANDLVNGMVPTNLAGVCVTFGAVRAPIFLITPGQLNVQVPQVAAPSAPAVQVIANCDSPNPVASIAVNVAVQPASPEFFYASSSGTGPNPVAATDGVSGAGIGDPTRLGPGFALAYPGETITIYATGLGLSSPPFAAGQLPPAGAPVSNVSVSIDGASLNASALQYAGVAPLNAGLYQLNIVLPASLTAGDHSIGMAVSGRTSPAAYISVGTASH